MVVVSLAGVAVVRVVVRRTTDGLSVMCVHIYVYILLIYILLLYIYMYYSFHYLFSLLMWGVAYMCIVVVCC